LKHNIKVSVILYYVRNGIYNLGEKASTNYEA